MAHIRKKKKKELPPVSTASLPDIVFMLLFFFMVSTTMREVDLLVHVDKPQVTEVQKIERKDLTTYIYIGAPVKKELYGTEPRLQLDEQLGTVEDVQAFITIKRESVNEKERPKFIVAMKADVDVKMGLVSDVKQELRKAQALKLMYSTNPAGSPEHMFNRMNRNR